ncbi:MFS transporter [Corynebacterium capitovis]|uniref:MFS transporter n=1 Tax=Corynebacterium capitovis TaxID=131081 RepID=UPI00037392D5|nr:MFS transporter [Corynebacterium capitovis]
MLVVGLAIFNSLYSTQALLPALSDAFQVSPSTVAWTVSAATGALALCVVPFSILSEKYGRGRILIISALAATVLGLCLPLAQSATQFAALRAVQGAMIAGTPAVAMTWLAEELDERDLASAMGLYIAGNTIGGLTGRLIPAAVMEVATWRWALFASSATALALALAFALLLPRQRNFVPKDSLRPSIELRAMGRHLRSPRLLGLYTTAFIAMGTFVSMYNFFGFRAVDTFGLSPALTGLIFLMYLSGTWSSARAGALVAHFGRGRVVLGSAVLMLGGAAVAISSSLPIALLGLLGFTASFFALHSVASGWVGLIASRDRAEASSLYVLFYYVGASVLGVATGRAFEAFPWWGFVLTLCAILGVLVAVAAALAAVEKRM